MRRPSPAFVVSIVALVLAGAGTSIAAVNFAKNAGAVDGFSAVGGASSVKHASGKLVAAKGSGPLTGKIPARFLDLSGAVTGGKQTFAQGIAVIDNATTAPVGLAGRSGVGLVTASCLDQAGASGVEDPQARIVFANGSGQPVNFSRSIGNGKTAISVVAPAAQAAFTIANANSFRIYAQVGSTHYVVEGVARQDGKGSAEATCAVYGYALAL